MARQQETLGTGLLGARPAASTAASSAEPANPLVAPSIALPKGGGAIRGIGEKFAANPVTGTGSMSVPIATSPGRSGFGPQLSLSYDSGTGNGPFGLGWSLSIPSITRKTDKGLPRYRDGADVESDMFILSGAEDLVPVLVEDQAGDWKLLDLPPRSIDGKTCLVRRYRPRIEGLFARIERWTNEADPKDVCWRSISSDNVTTWYGRTSESRIADPADPARIFSWLICESHDGKGNAIVYGYKGENSDDIDLSRVHERNRTEQSRAANRYLKRIRYGNRTPYDPVPEDNQLAPLPQEWLFEVVLDYGDHDPDAPLPDEAGRIWPCRNDPFSSFRSGFEIRAYRLCQRVLMFHHFSDEPDVGANCLVRSTDFTYSHEEDPARVENPVFSCLLSVTQSGYKRGPGGYLKKTLPPLECEYSQAAIDETVREVDPESLESLPIGLDGMQYRWVDLDGEGLSGILTEQAQGWFYKRNLSPLNVRQEADKKIVAARFAPAELVARKPSLAAVGGGQQFLDLSGDGQLDLVEFWGPTAGFYERTHDEDWETFTPFESMPVVGWADPNLKFVDLTGDGHADILITENEVFRWHASFAEAGFAPAERVHQAVDEDEGPRLVLTDGTQSIHLADLSGDGLSDLVRIRNGEVCYWPNLGYGRFGAKVTMDNAPWFDSPELFDSKRIRLADIDGTGTTDIVYLGRDGARLYFNESGNGWSPARTLAFPAVDDLSSVQVADLLGNGTACLVWSSSLPGDARRPMRYIDLMGGRKPHLLVRTANNLGAETIVHYAPSTKFYLQDRLDGRPWLTKLPFLVHVVERVETHDHVSRNRFVTRYAYHHGHFDGVEREFRGFGMVEQWDTEELAALAGAGILPATTNVDAASHVPPVLTRTWFHTGLSLGRDHVSDFFAGLLDANDKGEYYREPGLTDEQARARLLPDTLLPSGLTPDEEREACRALKGAMLRREIYARDGTAKEAHPYIVTEQNFGVRIEQPRGPNRHAVFFSHPREAITCHYERDPADPRVQHALTLEVDAFGNILKQATVAYGRRQPDASLPTDSDRDRQALVHITSTENTVTNAITDQPDRYRAPLPAEARTYELRRPQQDKGSDTAIGLFHFDAMLSRVTLAGDGNHDVAYEDIAFARAQQAATEDPAEQDRYFRRLVEHVRSLYRRDDLTALLPLGNAEPLGLPGESYRLAFTAGLLAQVFQRRREGQPPEPLLPDPAAVLGGQGAGDGGYLQGKALKDDGRFPASDADDAWWVPSGHIFFTPDVADAPATELAQARLHFFLPRRYRDPFGSDAVVRFDAHDLLMVETRDALDNRVTVDANDYRVLQPRLVSDPNRNRSEVAFDILGMVVGTAVMGKPAPAPAEGDSLAGFVANLTQSDADGFFEVSDPHTSAPALLGGATTRIVYDLDRFRRTRQANPDDPAAWQPACAATLARETHVSAPLPPQGLKIQIGFSYSDGFGREIQKKIQAEPGPVIDGGPVVSPRWVGSGWIIFNNKGKPVRQYEPFFAATHGFEFGVTVGVSPILFYDPAERVVATLHPNHAWEKVVFDPWRQETWQVSDTVLIADPRTDARVGAFFSRLAPADVLPSWHDRRSDGALGPQEQAAAHKATMHANTPTIVHSDSLGRAVLSVAHNRFKYSDTPEADAPVEEIRETRTMLDIEGNEREVIDAKRRVVMRYDYDMLGRQVHQATMEAGERWTANDVSGKPIRVWDSRGHAFRTEYDALRRPINRFVTGNDPARSDPRTLSGQVLLEKTEYGEAQPDAELLNLRDRAFRLHDSAGVVTNHGYDFKGNLAGSGRTLAQDYKAIADWAGAPAMGETYTSSTTYDALNRPVTQTAPDSSIIRRTFNEANLLEAIDVNLRAGQAGGQLVWTPFITDVDYNARGQRLRIGYGNGAETRYSYDPETFRLRHLYTRRGAAFTGDCGGNPPPTFAAPESPPAGQRCGPQNLRYTYDVAGNITHIRDDAQQTIFFDGQVVEPNSAYVYDAIGRLIEASGREHRGQTGQPQTNWNDAARVGLAHPQDGQAVRNYTERYAYDAVGNLLSLVHQADDGNWTRGYERDEASLLEPGKVSNRLTRSIVGGAVETVAYDAHGNMTVMPHLAEMRWDFGDRLCAVDLGGGGMAYYVYDGAGQRVRKVIERRNGARQKERLYLGGFEIFRDYDGSATATLERQSLHVMDEEQRIALVETRTLGDDGSSAELVRYQLGNHLGSASVELDDAGQLISYEEYHPYGTTAYQAARSGVASGAKRYRYTGRERDEETGFYYHGARYYVAWLGIWVSCDPATLTVLVPPTSGNATLRSEVVTSSTFLDDEPDDKARLDPEASLKSALATSVPADTRRRSQAESSYEAFHQNPQRYVDPDGREPTDTDAGEKGAKSERPKSGASGSKQNWSEKAKGWVTKGFAIVGMVVGIKVQEGVVKVKPVRQQPSGPDTTQVEADEKRRRSKKKAKGEGGPDPEGESKRQPLDAKVRELELELELAKAQREFLELQLKMKQLEIEAGTIERERVQLEGEMKQNKILLTGSVALIVTASLFGGAALFGGAGLGAAGAGAAETGTSGGGLGWLLPAFAP